eukprot:gnl/TRDRNA2_/TRDRNA2_196807_c0_seq1.p1 gnl/TRDRNA2_/TRDRNA2_196807_c0~~gnl/TRDRNA2_/TRDRNA2_196807_c0_seq1.p1  ORF type:complete len:229 (-),score=38.69 gnl/TRDRNA2_/TRDRNA2_196807_c0_seq1:58-744(-)
MVWWSRSGTFTASFLRFSVATCLIHGVVGHSSSASRRAAGGSGADSNFSTELLAAEANVTNSSDNEEQPVSSILPLPAEENKTDLPVHHSEDSSEPQGIPSIVLIGLFAVLCGGAAFFSVLTIRCVRDGRSARSRATVQRVRAGRDVFLAQLGGLRTEGQGEEDYEEFFSDREDAPRAAGRAARPAGQQSKNAKIARIIAMGFPRERAVAALTRSNWDERAATDMLLG